MKLAFSVAFIALLIVGILINRSRRVSDSRIEQDGDKSLSTPISVDRNIERSVRNASLGKKEGETQQVKEVADSARIVLEDSDLDRFVEKARLRLDVLKMAPSQIDSIGRIMAIEEQLKNKKLQLSKTQIDALETGVKADLGEDTFRLASLGLSDQHWHFVGDAILEGMPPDRTFDLLKLHGDIHRDWESGVLNQNPTIVSAYAAKLVQLLGPKAAGALWKRSVIEPVFLNSLGSPD